MSNWEPARFHASGSKSFFIVSASMRPDGLHTSFASPAHCSIDERMSSDICAACFMASPAGGASPRKANGGGLPSTHAWNRLFWFSLQNFSQSFGLSLFKRSLLENKWGQTPIELIPRFFQEIHELA